MIDFKQPKYILPLILLPFFIFFYFMIGNMFTGKQTDTLVTTEYINTDIPTPDLNKKRDKNKFEAGKDASNKITDYSAIQALEPEIKEQDEMSSVSLYTDDEITEIETMHQETKILEEIVKREEKRRVPKLDKKETDSEMTNFVKQMNYLDSMNKANDPALIAEEKKRKEKEDRERKRKRDEEENPTFEVIKSNSNTNASSSSFNTILGGNLAEDNNIKVMLDEGLKLYDGHRIRLRLMDNISIAGVHLQKNSYIYAVVSGFKSQRVIFKITNIVADNKPLKVLLSIHDMDGMEGLYVPGNSLRDLSKDIGGTSQNINMNQSGAGGAEEFAYSALQDIYKSTSSAISKKIKQINATTKYNTVLYLVNKKEQK